MTLYPFPIKSQCSMPNVQTDAGNLVIAHWALVIDWSLGFAHWSLPRGADERAAQAAAVGFSFRVWCRPWVAKPLSKQHLA